MSESYQNSTQPLAYQEPPHFEQDIGDEELQQPASSKYETALPIRIDIAAALCYVLGCVSGILFLMFEWKNAYVRFHAYQSALVFTFTLVIWFIFYLISGALAWLIFIMEVVAILWLALQAHQNGQSLVRYEVPYFGTFASRWVDQEVLATQI